MHFIIMVLIGFVIGLVARAITPGTQSLGFILTSVLGIAGSCFAGWVGQQMHWYAAGAPVGFFAAVFGAVALLLIVGLIKGR